MPTPVTFKLLIVAIPVTFKSLTLAIPVTFKFKVVVTPITVKFLVVVSPPTPNVAIVAIPVTFKSVKFVLSILTSVTVKIPTKPVVAVTNPTEVIPDTTRFSLTVAVDELRVIVLFKDPLLFLAER